MKKAFHGNNKICGFFMNAGKICEKLGEIFSSFFMIRISCNSSKKLMGSVLKWWLLNYLSNLNRELTVHPTTWCPKNHSKLKDDPNLIISNHWTQIANLPFLVLTFRFSPQNNLLHVDINKECDKKNMFKEKKRIVSGRQK